MSAIMSETPITHRISRIFVFSGQDIIVPGNPDAPSWFDASFTLPGGFPLPSPEDSRAFEWNDAGYLSFSIEEDEALRLVAAGAGRMQVRQAIAVYPHEEVRAFLKGLALSTWIRGARYCGACGSPLADAVGQDTGGRICTACGRVHFPKISPAVITLVRKGDKALLARNSRFPAGRFGLIAGFVEAGETLEETVRRETREEAGIEVDSITYRTSQPWPFPDSLMVAFTARWASGEARPDGVEIAELRWCTPFDLPAIPPPGSVARFLIDEFVDKARNSAPASGGGDGKAGN